MYFDWINILTPIEYNVWSDIKYLGLPFYPQFPVGRYFIDFADPIKKIGIEVDSKQWHTDKDKDEKRQKELEKLGWRIIRIQGKHTYKQKEDYFTDEFNEEMNCEDIEVAEEKIREKKELYISTCSEGMLEKLRDEEYMFWKREEIKIEIEKL